MVDKVKAVELRQQGLNYKEIAQELGCSEIWCKKNLKDINKNKVEFNIIKELTVKALSSDGVTKYEMLKSFNYEELTNAEVNTTLKKVYA